MYTVTIEMDMLDPITLKPKVQHLRAESDKATQDEAIADVQEYYAQEFGMMPTDIKIVSVTQEGAE